MKIGKFLYAAIEAVAGAAVAVAISAKLDELKSKYAEAWAKMIAVTDPTSQEAIDAKMAVWKLDGEINAEKAEIKKAENEAKVAEMRNERLALNKAQFTAYDALLAVKFDKKAKPEDVSAAETAFNTAKELVDNELLAKYASSSAGRKSVAKTDGASEQSASGEHKAKIIEMFLAGKSHKDIQDETGIPRSTVWHTINNYKKANG